MPNSKDKYLDDLLAINQLAAVEQLVKELNRNPGVGDVLAGILARSLIGAVSPSTLKSLDKMGLAPGRK